MRQLSRLAIVIAVAGSTFSAVTAFAATEAQKQAVIDSGLAYLATQQQANGRWVYDNSTGDVGATGAALLAFIEEGHTPTSGTAYSNVVANGLNWIWQSGIKSVNISAQPMGNPDTNGDGIGYKFNSVSGSNSVDNYNTGIVLPALIKAGAGSTVINSPGSVVNGKTYGQVAQNVVDFLAYSQADPAAGAAQGGWRYGTNVQGADNSVSQWPALALLYAKGAGYNVPQFVTEAQRIWLQYSQNDSNGGAGYDGPGSTSALRTGSWLVQAKLSGTLSAAEIQAAKDYIDLHWTNDGSIFSDSYGMWAVYKGLESMVGIDNMSEITMNIGTCVSPSCAIDNPNHGWNWWEGMNEALYDNWVARGSGGSMYLGGYGSVSMTTAWGVNILQAVEINQDDGTVPEPATLALLGAGLLGAFAIRRRRP